MTVYPALIYRSHYYTQLYISYIHGEGWKKGLHDYLRERDQLGQGGSPGAGEGAALVAAAHASSFIGTTPRGYGGLRERLWGAAELDDSKEGAASLKKRGSVSYPATLPLNRSLTRQAVPSKHRI